MNNNTDEKVLALLVKETVGLNDNMTLTLLAGDASTRKYYRARDKTHSVVVVLSEPYAANDPSIVSNVAFKKLGAPVPLILKVFPEKGVMIKEDLGDVHLQDIKDPKELVRYYDRAVQILVSYQLNGTRSGDDLYPLSYSFTKEKFISELDMTTEYYIKGYKQKSLKKSEQKWLETFYEELVDKMMAQKNMLLHRDYHSRNLMIKDGAVYVIDYQDSRLGPYSYDVASLVMDPYIELDRSLRERIVANYYEGVKECVKVTSAEFKRHYDLCSLQRGIKILGTFAYQKLVRNKDQYLKYICPSEDKVKDVLKSFPEWEPTALGVLFK